VSEIPVTTIHLTNTEAKIELLKEWESRKGNEPWTLDEIAELIASVHSLAEERIIKLIDDIAAPYGEGALISVDLLKMLIKGENK
jgi:Tat protein secretion system quality control protein TatD with DNase activity